MSNAKKKPLHRALAALLALVMVLTLIPWQTTALAADEADGKTKVTITVKDKKQKPVKGAIVSFTTAVKQPAEPEAKPETKAAAKPQVKLLETDKNGQVVLGEATAEEIAKMTISYTVSKDGYQPVTAEKAEIPADGNIQVMLKKVPIDVNVNVEPVNTVYDGEAHPLVKVTAVLPTKMGGKTVLAEQEVTNGNLPDGVKSVKYEATINGQTVQGDGIPVATNVKDPLCGASVTVTVVLNEGLNAAKPTQIVTAGKITPAKLEDIELERRDLKFQGIATKQELAGVSGILPSDSVLWTVVADYKNYDKETHTYTEHSAPKDSYRGVYTVTLHVERDNGNYVYESTVTTGIDKKVINVNDDLKITAVEGLVYQELNGSPAEQPLLTVENHGSGYQLRFKVSKDGGAESEWVMETADKPVPTASEPGTYTVKVQAYEDEDTETEDEGTYTVKIDKAEQTIRFVNEDYNAQNSVKVLSAEENIPKYLDFQAQDSSWVTNADRSEEIKYELIYPENTEKNAAEFAEAKIVDITEQQTDPNTGETTTVVVKRGQVQATSFGKIVVKATLTGDAHYKDAEITHTLMIKGLATELTDKWVSFYDVETSTAPDGTSTETHTPVTEGSYVLNVPGNVVVTHVAHPVNNGKKIPGAEPLYSIRGNGGVADENNLPIGEDAGLEIESGVIKVVDYSKLVAYMNDPNHPHENGNLVVYAFANLYQMVDGKKYGHALGHDSYPLTIKFAETPAAEWDFGGKRDDIDDDEFWFFDDDGEIEDDIFEGITVSLADYQLASEIEKDGTGFNANMALTAEGENAASYYTKDSAGNVSAKKTVSANIDTVAPSKVKIDIVENNPVMKLLQDVGIFDKQVKVTFTATDATSGVDHFVWSYTGEKNTAGSTKDYTNQKTTKVQHDEGTTTYTAEIYLPMENAEDQFNGSITVQAVDKASNVSKETTSNQFIVDTIKPHMAAAPVFTKVADTETVLNAADGVYYSNGDVRVDLAINEANFDENMMDIYVLRDGEEIPVLPEGVQTFKRGDKEEEGEEGEEGEKPEIPEIKPSEKIRIVWTADKTSQDLHKGSFTLTKDGDYSIYIKGMDRAGNALAVENAQPNAEGYYEFKSIQLDKTAPDLKDVAFSKEERQENGVFYHNQDVKVTMTMVERNFHAEEMIVTVKCNGEVVATPAINWTAEKNTHTGVFTLEALKDDHSKDGDYTIEIAYTDRAGNAMEGEVPAVQHTIDTTIPVVQVDYEPLEAVKVMADRHNGEQRSYFDSKRTATITVTEHNFDPASVDFEIIAADVNNSVSENGMKAVNEEMQAIIEKAKDMSAWKKGANPDEYVTTITYSKDANYTFDVKCADLATNEAVDREKDYFTVDMTKPVELKVSYDAEVQDSIRNTDFYNAIVKVTISAEDPISSISAFDYKCIIDEDVSAVNKGQAGDVQELNIRYEKDDLGKASASFKLPVKLNKNNQFNGHVEFTATDRAGLVSQHKEDKTVIVDNIAPIADISFNKPVNVVNGIHYYAGNINAVVSINEANFFQNDVIVLVSKDGGAATRVSPKWKSAGGDIHNGTFTITGDGDYVVTVAYTDKSSNKMTSYKSAQMTIDTQIKAPTFSINGTSRNENGGSYKKDAVIGFAFNDRNFAGKTIQLIRTNFDSRVDVTDQFVKVNGNSKGGAGSFAIPAKTANDGIYTITVSINDKANHTAKSTMNFTVNRFGSVYEYSDSLVELIRDGGQYVTAVEEDLVITEYNADKIKNGSLKIMITRDGEAIDVDYKAVPVNGGGWNKYVYTIDADNFKADGLYKISVSSAYPTSDSDKNESASVPENSVNEKGGKILDKMSFTVDTQKPEIRNIVNMDAPIVNATELKVKYNIVDVGGIQAIEVLVNGASVDKVTEFGDDVLNYNGEFTLKEMSDAQVIQLRITDRAGNITDTAAEDFNAQELAFAFNDKVTVSTNFFVRWYANKGLFWGSICGVVVLAGAVWYLVAGKRRKNEGSAQ